MLRKQFPSGTFIPTAARVCAIIQLCLAFAIIAWNTSYPFMGELFEYKSRLLLFQDIMGIPNDFNSKTENNTERLKRNSERFRNLPQKQLIEKQFQSISKLSQRTFLEKMERSFGILLKLPVFLQAWLLLSIIIPILLLKRVEGAVQAVWLLPLLTAFYAWDNQFFGVKASQSAEFSLFPTEAEIINYYIGKPLSSEIFQQKEELTHAWKRYLIVRWTKHSESPAGALFDLQAEEGEFAFNVARIQAMSNSVFEFSGKRTEKEALPVLALYVFWNFFFAATAWRHMNCLSHNPDPL